MSKKFIRRWIPSRQALAEHRAARLFRPLLEDPHLFHLNRHSASTAMFVGLFCAFLPMPGQTLAAALLSLALRCNLPMAVALVWLTNPLTMPVVFFSTFELGRWLLGSPPLDLGFHFDWHWLVTQGRQIFAPLLLGGLTLGFVLGGLGYLIVRQLWRWQVVRNWEARKKRRRG